MSKIFIYQTIKYWWEKLKKLWVNEELYPEKVVVTQYYKDFSSSQIIILRFNYSQSHSQEFFLYFLVGMDNIILKFIKKYKRP